MTTPIFLPSGLRIYYLLQDFFPRTNPTDNSIVDKGHFSKDPCSCKNCTGSRFKSVSIEYCPTCGYFVDYWLEEGKDNKKYLTSCEPVRLEEWYLLKKIEKMLQKESCDADSYPLSFHLNTKS